MPDAAALERARTWFASKGWHPFPWQEEAWRAFLSGESGLVHAPTGTGKTLAVWIGPLLDALAAPATGNGLRVLWLTPLRALAADTVESLRDAARERLTGRRPPAPTEPLTHPPAGQGFVVCRATTPGASARNVVLHPGTLSFTPEPFRGEGQPSP